MAHTCYAYGSKKNPGSPEEPGPKSEGSGYLAKGAPVFLRIQMEDLSSEFGCMYMLAREAVAGARVPLDNTRTSIPTLAEGEKKRVDSRKKRYQLRNELRKVTGLERLKKCGHTPVSGGGVAVRATQTAEGVRAGYAGLATCGSVWACPVCSAKISAQRSEEIGQVLNRAQRRGYSLALVTLTVRHHKGQGLREVWDAVASGWKAVTTGSGWLADQKKYGIKGWVKAVEVTHGANGWHVHVHTALIFKAQKDVSFDVQAKALGLRLFSRWQTGLGKVGFTASRKGFDAQAVGTAKDAEKLAHYLAKGAGMAKEATLGQFKEAKNGNRTPFQILQSLLDAGDMEDLALWHEWESGSRGRRQIGWAKGLREWAGVGESLSDEELAQQELGTSDDDLVLLPGDSWEEVRAQGLEVKVLEVAEALGALGLRQWLDFVGLAWQEPPRRE